MEYSRPDGCVISGLVTDADGCGGPVRRAEVRLSLCQGEGDTVRHEQVDKCLTDDHGRFRFEGLIGGRIYRVECQAFGQSVHDDVTVHPGADHQVHLKPDLCLTIRTLTCPDEGAAVDQARGMIGHRTLLRVGSHVPDHIVTYEITASHGASVTYLPDGEAEVMFTHPGIVRFEVWVTDQNANSFGEYAQAFAFVDFGVSEAEVQMIGGRIRVALERPAVPNTHDQALWPAIRNRTRAISFGPYRDFIDRVLHAEEHEKFGVPALDRRFKELGAHMHGVGAFQLLKTATEAFLLLECGVRIHQGRSEHHRLFQREDESARLGEHVTLDFMSAKLREYLGSPPQLPYIARVLQTVYPEIARGDLRCDRVLTSRINEPCLIELIWSYWHEEGMLVQTMNAINRRFQNVAAPGDRDPLAHFELDPLRRVGNILWGQIQDELNLLPVKRRGYEYSHHYGLSLYGRAAGSMRPADNRSKFLEAFHNLLHLTSVFYKEDNDTTVIADGFPLLNALKEVHLLLAQGAHNQFGDLPWTARAEMMVQQWILSRPEIREFLQSRHMVPYKEAWMPQVDTMKTLQGWSDVTVTHFRDLGVYGEQILLSIRYGDWIDITDEASAKNWARYWRPEVQGYLHGYRAVTGVDLTNSDMVDATVPAVHLQKRLAGQYRAR